MATTTIRLPEGLKPRIACAAKHAGTTSRIFIPHAIAEKAALVEQRDDFQAAAEMRYAVIAASGKTIAWPNMQCHLKDRVAGKKTARPVAKKLAR